MKKRDEPNHLHSLTGWAVIKVILISGFLAMKITRTLNNIKKLNFPKTVAAIDLSLAALLAVIAAVLYAQSNIVDVASFLLMMAVYFSVQNVASFVVPHVTRMPKVFLLFLRTARIWQLFLPLLVINISFQASPLWNLLLIGPLSLAACLYFWYWKASLPFTTLNHFEIAAQRPKYKFNIFLALCLVITFDIPFSGFAIPAIYGDWQNNFWIVFGLEATMIAAYACSWTFIWKSKINDFLRLKYALWTNHSTDRKYR